MPTYYPPGKRRDNEFYVVRGSFDGKRHEFRCASAKSKRAAEKEWDEFKRQTRDNRDVASSTFSDVMAAYKEARNLSGNDIRYLDKLGAAWIKGRKMKFGDIPIADVVQNDIAQAAGVLYPGCLESTKNRQAYAPAAAVLHYAAESKIIPWERIAKLKEADPETTRPAKRVPEKLLEAANGIEREFLLFIFCQGWRVTETLKHDWKYTNLQTRTFRVFVSKAGKWKTIHMAPDVFLMLAQRPQDEGPLFPWKDRHEVYKWLKPLRERLGVRFTPHMARHEWGSRQAEAGGTSQDAVTGSTWTNRKSVDRYETPDQDHARKIAARVTFGAKMGQASAK